MNDSNDNRVFWREFIELYREYPCLWKVGTKEYGDRNKKSAAYKILANKLREKFEGANRETVVRKINTLRSCFRKEYKKVQASLKSGAMAADVYRPSLWYYDLLLFLHDQEEPRFSSGNLDETIEAVDIPEEEPQSLDSVPSEEITKSPHLPIIENYRVGSSYEGNQGNHHQNINFKKRKFKENTTDTNLDVVLSLVKDKLESHHNSRPYEDEYEAIGRNVAAKLRRIPNRLRIIAERLIGEVLFRAEINTLDINSKITIDLSSINPPESDGYSDNCNNAGVPNQYDLNRQEEIYVKEEPTDAILLQLTERS
ncbi:UNVERIFIED_CONTAM: hypothetical protein RMT77_010209 [Armadillidium vulgare]